MLEHGVGVSSSKIYELKEVSNDFFDEDEDRNSVRGSIREPNNMRQSCASKLAQVQISDHFQAILVFAREDWTTPRLVDMVRHLQAICLVDVTASRVISLLGKTSDLNRNIHGVLRLQNLMG